jgi:hypothetical protein
MTADWVARGIAMGGVLFTASSTAIAFATFRRGKPDLKLVIENARIGSSRNGATKGRVIFNVRAINGGPLPVKLDVIDFIAVYRGFHDKGTPTLGDNERTLLRTVDHHSGKVIQRSVRLSGLIKRDQVLKYVRVVGRLSTGQALQGNRVKGFTNGPDFKSLRPENIADL